MRTKIYDLENEVDHAYRILDNNRKKKFIHKAELIMNDEGMKLIFIHLINPIIYKVIFTIIIVIFAECF